MRYAIKNKKKTVKAYRLGAGDPKEIQLIREGAIRVSEDGSYELFSREAVNGVGEKASAGDYFKVDEVDGKSYPYPNKKDWFEANHTLVEGNVYEQANKPLEIWEAEDPKSDVIEYLLQTGQLEIHEEDEKNYFYAVLWGAPESQSRDAVIVFYSVEREAGPEAGEIRQVSFNFVARDFFEENYSYCDEKGEPV